MIDVYLEYIFKVIFLTASWAIMFKIVFDSIKDHKQRKHSVRKN